MRKSPEKGYKDDEGSERVMALRAALLYPGKEKAEVCSSSQLL